MSNPWLNLSLGDYEGHMNSPGVQQLQALSELFREVLNLRRPASVAILGVAGGNGLEHIQSNITKRVVGLDFNPLYLDEARRRFPSLPGFELRCVDLASQAVHLEPVDLVHAALVFEHAGVGQCLENALSLVAERGALSVVLQLPAQAGSNISATAYPSMQTLKAHFSLVDQAWLCRELETRGFQVLNEVQRALPATKSFWMGIFFRG